VPVAVFNNAKGRDAEALARFGEPAWNNPVVRFLDAEGKDLLPRKDGIYTLQSLFPRMKAALEAAGKTVPPYLGLAAFEHAPSSRETAVFAMYCYWEGEKTLGRIEGVLATRIGTIEKKHEVVEVEFDPGVVAFEKLLETARSLKCAGRVFARTDAQFDLARAIVGEDAVRSDEPVDDRTEQQKHLSGKRSMAFLPLSRLQATKANAAIAAQEDPDAWLSPRQVALRKQLLEALRDEPGFLEGLKPDRTPAGLGAYDRELGRRLAAREEGF
jgi:hypothetical protein